MKKLSTLFLLLIIGLSGNSQLLVLNNSFEEYSSCPNNWNQIEKATYWINPSGHNFGTPDYFNACANNFLQVPDNGLGYQETYSGVGYAGLFLYGLDVNAREYIEVPLTQELEPNSWYHFEMFINLVEYSKYSTDAIGAYFSDTLVIDQESWLLPFSPQVSNVPGNYPDTANWTIVEGNFEATGNEKYLIIGNFKDDENTEIFPINDSGVFDYCYVLVDNISLQPRFVTSNSTIKVNGNIQIYPNPASSELTIEAEQLNGFSIIDIFGKERISLQVNSDRVTIDISAYPKSVYLIEVKTGDTTQYEKLIIK